ncbi:MAG: hypothetical protein GVY04_11975 [Cyanobacteria bacterium]|jgi:hypothetical protein|nr:hypothetical protein [Cyanobacteria bacterium GSL.Bin1]
MLVSEFKTGNVPPLPASLADTDDINQYIINLVAHAYYTGIEIDNRDHNGKRRQRRLYSFEVLEFPNMNSPSIPREKSAPRLLFLFQSTYNHDP